VDFPCVWRGLDFVDGLAAKYPEVIDYYLRDGKDRLESTVQRLLAIAGLKNPAASPAGSMDSLKELHEALNQFDPHFYYDFSVETPNADGSCPPVQVTPGMLAAVRLSNNERCITYKIIPRFDEATKERPAPGSMKLIAEPGSALEEQIEDWAKFGTPLKDVPAKDICVDLPGGFGGLREEARVSIFPAKPEPRSVTEVSLRVLEPDGTIAAILDFVTEEASRGIDHQSGRNVGYDKEAGLVRYEMRISADEATVCTNLRITIEEPTGRLPVDMLSGLRFITTLAPPRQVQIFARNGPALVPPMPVEQATIPEEKGKLWLLMCESLATIQEHVIDRITFPDMERYHAENPMADIEAWYQAARLLRGESLPGTWSGVGVHLNPGVEPPSEIQQGILNNAYSVRIGDQTYQLGVVTMQVATLRVDETVPPIAHDDHMDVRFVPGGDDTMTMSLATSSPRIVGVPSSS
jgi:hypothetical protein